MGEPIMSDNLSRKISEALSSLFNKSLKELNGVFYVYMIDEDEDSAIAIWEKDNKIYVKNFIPKLTDGYLEHIKSIISEIISVEIIKEDDKAVLVFPATKENEAKILFALSKAYEEFMLDKPKESISIFGGFKIMFFGKKYSALSRGLTPPKIFSENFFTFPDSKGWINSFLGRDNIHMPIFAWRYGDKILSYVPNEDGTLIVFDITALFKKIKELLEMTNSSLILEEESDIFSNLQRIEEQLEIIGSTLEGKTFPFAPVIVEHPDKDKIRSLYEEVKRGIDLIKKTISLSRFIEQKLMLRLAVQLAERILKGEVGILSMSTRKVSKLGAGFAVYISKEEAKIVELKDKVTVKIIVEEGAKPKIVIQ